MIYTLEHAREFCAPFVGEGKAADSDDVLEALNEATEILVDEAHWKYLLRRMRVVTTNNYFTLPQSVESVVKVAFDHRPAYVFSPYYEFLDGGPGPLDDVNDTVEENLHDLGDGYPTLVPLTEATQLIALSTAAGDVDKELRIRGVDSDENEIGPTVPGEVLNVQQWDGGVEGTINHAAMVGAYITTNSFYEIASVVKAATVAPVTLLAYNPTDQTSTVLARYSPNDTHPGYRRYRITNSGSDTESTTVEMLVKLRYMAMQYDSDVLLIQSLPALKLMCKAIHQLDYGDANMAEGYQQRAVRLLSKRFQSAGTITNEFDYEVDEGVVNNESNLYGEHHGYC